MRWLLLAMTALSGPASGAEYFTLEGHGGPIMGLAVSAGGRVASTSFDSTVGLWSGTRPEWLESHRAAVNCVVFVSETTLVSGGDDFALVRWDMPRATATRMDGHQGKVMALAVSPGGTQVASASWDGSIGIWPLDGGAPRFLRGHDGPVNDVAFTTDGARLYSASADGSLRVWDVATGTERARLVEHGFGLNEIVLNEAAGWLAYGAVDGGTRVIGAADAAPIADLSLDRRPILAMEMTPDGGTLAVGDGEGYIMLIDTRDWSVVSDFHATARGPVWALAFSADGENILSGGLDDAVHAWPVADLESQEPLAAAAPSYLADPKAMPNGERQFKRKCSICHTLTHDGARRAGPSLQGLFGRRAGSMEGYRYSGALDESDLVWNDRTIDALFDIGPEHYIPGTKMPMQRITAARDRADLIDYLRTATAPKE